MRRDVILSGKVAVWLLGMLVAGSLAVSAEPEKLEFDIYGGYFVSNKYEPDAAESFILIRDQATLETVLGVAFVMGDKSHRLPAGAFDRMAVVVSVKRGTATWKFHVEKVIAKDAELELHYSAVGEKQPSATFATPLIVSVPKRDYATVRFIENGKEVKSLKAAR